MRRRPSTSSNPTQRCSSDCVNCCLMLVGAIQGLGVTGGSEWDQRSVNWWIQLISRFMCTNLTTSSSTQGMWKKRNRVDLMPLVLHINGNALFITILRAWRHKPRLESYNCLYSCLQKRWKYDGRELVICATTSTHTSRDDKIMRQLTSQSKLLPEASFFLFSMLITLILRLEISTL